MFITRSLALALCWFAAFAVVAQDSQPLPSRQMEVRHIEDLGGGKVRFFVSVYEYHGGIRFPITTLQRSDFSVHFANIAAPPAIASSLSNFVGPAADRQRQLVLALNMTKDVSESAAQEIKAALGEILPLTFSGHLALYQVAPGSVKLISEITPEKSENLSAVERQVLLLEREGSGPAFEEGVCTGADAFERWQDSPGREGDQRAVLLIGLSGALSETNNEHLDRCWQSLASKGVRVFQVGFDSTKAFKMSRSIDSSALMIESGGFRQEVSGPWDVVKGLRNIVSNLNNEFIVDTVVPEVPIEDQPLEVMIQVKYHDENVQSTVKTLPFQVPPPITPTSPIPADSFVGANQEESKLIVKSLILSVPFLIGIVAVWIGIRLYLRHRHYIRCSTCLTLVHKDYADCPFKDKKCRARLVVLTGAHAGAMLALREGDNTVGRSRSCQVRIAKAGLRRHHGIIRIQGERAFYLPNARHADRINGWQVGEGRLLGSGYVLEIGTIKLRFEAPTPGFQIHKQGRTA